MWLEHGVNVPSGTAGVVSQGHGGATDDINVRHNTAAHEAIAQATDLA
jgi:hypothetical protein